MRSIRHIQEGDKTFWFSLDKYLSDVEFERKVRNKMGYCDAGELNERGRK